uniref:Rhodanese domain-containing protein n=1 Tax=Macrostomum lignano TaxID=282301 RepID=A0A1I8HDA5_9PLAT
MVASCFYAQLLIIDSRSLLDFNLSCIRTAINVCCSRLVKRRLQQGKLSINDLLPSDPCCVVLYDEGSELLPPPPPPSQQRSNHCVELVGAPGAGGSDSACFVYLLLQRLAARYSTVRLLQ